MNKQTGQSEQRSRTTLVTATQAARDIYAVSERKFYLMRKAGLVPAPVVIGRVVRFVRAELESAVLSLPRQTELAEPHQLRNQSRRAGK